MKYITYYTDGYYEKVYNDYLKKSCEQFSVPIIAYKQSNLKDWGQNTRLKAIVLLECLREYNDDIVYIDADATILAYPKLFEEIPKEYDIAVHYFDWWRHWRNVIDNPTRVLCNGTMFLRNNIKVIILLEDWIRENAKTTIYEQSVLESVLKFHKEVEVYSLPDEYCCIATRDNKIPEYVKSPVIFHNQISRNVKANKSLLY